MGYFNNRKCLPYGKWVCDDGREVLFNRDYQPIYERRPGRASREADSREWVEDIKQTEFFYSDSNPPWLDQATLRKCSELLETFNGGL